MGLRMLLGVLGLQLCLFCSAHGTDSGSPTLLQQSRLDHGSETWEHGKKQDEVPAFGLEQKYLAPQDPHVIQMKHRERRQLDKKKKKKPNHGAFSPLGAVPPSLKEKTASSRTKRHDEAHFPSPLLPLLPPYQGRVSPLGTPQVHHGGEGARKADISPGNAARSGMLPAPSHQMECNGD